MAFGTTLVHVQVLSIVLETLTSVRIKYAVGVLDAVGVVYNLLPVSEDSFTILLTLTPGNPIPGVGDICNVVANDLQTRFGGVPDVVVVDGQAYPYPPPGP